jgi:hypothetical protein
MNMLPDTVALHEPLLVRRLDHEVIGDEIDRFLQETRKSLLESGTAVSKHVDGRVPDNPIADEYPSSLRQLVDRLWSRRLFGPDTELGLRRSRVSRGVITVEKRLSSDFVLCIKHPAVFTAILDRLLPLFRCYAVVRNPVAVLASWNSCWRNVYNGHSPTAELFDPELAQALSQMDNRIDRQFHLLSWFFSKYRAILPAESILRYEDIVASRGVALSAITPRATELHKSLENRNTNQLYDHALMRALGIRLLKTDGPFWEFYSQADIENVLEEISR